MTDPNERLDPATHMDTLSLRVFDLTTMVEYYTHGVGLVLLSEGGGTLTLGLGDRPVLKLVHAPELRRPPSSAAGLYHSAVLFDSQADLSASLLSIFTSHPHTYTGSADHLVSEAFYFTDPEGNGLELYADRPRESWQWDGDQVRMATIYLDPSQFVNSHIDRDLVESDAVPNSPVCWATPTCRSEISRPPTSSTSGCSASTRPPGWAGRRSSSPPAATTTTSV